MIRSLFDLPDGLLYFAGHSLGPAPKLARARLLETVDAHWGARQVRSWTEADWMGLAERIGGHIADLVGARANEVMVADSVSVNLFKLIAAVCAIRPKRSEILVEADDFPTDAYVAASAAAALGKTVVLAPRQGLAARLNHDTAVVITSHVHYRSAHAQNMQALNSQAALVDAPVIWDLSHSVGAMGVELAAHGAQLAVGCGYKYLSGGPGAPAFIYVSQDMQRQLRNPIAGWMGSADPFAFRQNYVPRAGAAAFASGTPPILSLIALEAAVEVIAAAAPDKLQEQARENGQAFIDAIAPHEAQLGLTRVSPIISAERGAHVAYRHAFAPAIVKALEAESVIGDSRPPDLMRFGFAPLYVTAADARAGAAALLRVLRSGIYRDKRFAA
ncbi:MAG: aminotransferase class V-fold PLP-dependent enzyme [Alphaproteobacteria bacterium]|nr:aminotransferase class V-fold PLP-dependent enzyme [Alphaproteobacteria bacterium]